MRHTATTTPWQFDERKLAVIAAAVAVAVFSIPLGVQSTSHLWAGILLVLIVASRRGLTRIWLTAFFVPLLRLLTLGYTAEVIRMSSVDLVEMPILMGLFFSEVALLASTGLWWRSVLDHWMLEHRLARVDLLTGLLNRRGLEERLEGELSRSRSSGRPFLLLLIDCDGFKKINDEIGHVQGDEVLIVLSRLMRGLIRPFDSAARLGGDEFLILLPESNAATARRLIFQIRSGLMNSEVTVANSLRFSVGILEATGNETTLGRCLDQVDSLMYFAKNSGGDREEFRSLLPKSPGAVSADARSAIDMSHWSQV